jgi:hypothetical protein
MSYSVVDYFTAFAVIRFKTKPAERGTWVKHGRGCIYEEPQTLLAN